MPKRRLAALSVGALAAGALSFGALAPASAATGTIKIDKSFDYACDVTLNYVIAGTGPGTGPGDLTLKDQAIGVRAQSTVPATVFAGQTVAPTPATITLTMNAGLQAATVGLGGVSVDGSSQDSTIGFTIAGQQTAVPINDLKVTKSPIPATGTWTIPTAGTVAAIPVPAAAKGHDATLQMPSKFTANANFEVDPAAGLTSMSAVMACTFDDESPELLAEPLPVVSPATTSIAVASPSTPYGSAPQLSYTVSGADAGKVQVLEGGKVLANGSFSGGKGSVTLPKLAVGRHGITVKYAGAYGSLASSGSGTVTVVKASASIGSVKAKPKKIKAKKTKAKLAVQVASAAGAPTGTVTVKLKKKTLGSATLVGGKATVKLKKFAKAGKQKLTVAYSGSADFNGASKTVKVKVTK